MNDMTKLEIKTGQSSYVTSINMYNKPESCFQNKMTRSKSNHHVCFKEEPAYGTRTTVRIQSTPAKSIGNLNYDYHRNDREAYVAQFAQDMKKYSFSTKNLTQPCVRPVGKPVQLPINRLDHGDRNETAVIYVDVKIKAPNASNLVKKSAAANTNKSQSYEVRICFVLSNDSKHG